MRIETSAFENLGCFGRQIRSAQLIDTACVTSPRGSAGPLAGLKNSLN
jgi:hypothetical protein